MVETSSAIEPESGVHHYLPLSFHTSASVSKAIVNENSFLKILSVKTVIRMKNI